MGRKWLFIVCVLAFITSQNMTGQVEGAALSSRKAFSLTSQQQDDCLNLSAPALTGPADGIVVLLDPETGQIAGDTKFQWTAVEGVQRYFLQTERDGSGMAPVSRYASTNEIPISEALNDPISVPLGWYRWRVAALDLTEGCPYMGPYSEFRSFRVVDNQVFKPVDLEASDGTFADRVKITWDLDTSDGLYYPDSFSIFRTTVGRYPREATEISGGLGPEIRAFEDTDLVTNEKYVYWVVAIHNTYGEQRSNNDQGSSTPVCLPLSAPVLGWPDDGAALWLDGNGGTEDGLSWDYVIGAGRYEIEVQDINTGEQFTGESEDTMYNFTHHQVGTYRWHVRAFSELAGCAEISPWSDFRTFKFYFVKAYPVVNLAASDGTYPDRVVLTWEVDPDKVEEYVRYTNPNNFDVLRSTSLTGEKEQIAGPITYEGSEMSYRYEDTNASPGVKYFYWVIANHEIEHSNTSDPEQGWAYAAQTMQPVFLPFVKR